MDNNKPQGIWNTHLWCRATTLSPVTLGNMLVLTPMSITGVVPSWLPVAKSYTATSIQPDHRRLSSIKTEEVSISAPVMASCSSRGPSIGSSHLLKPDICAPGIDIGLEVDPRSSMCNIMLAHPCLLSRRWCCCLCEFLLSSRLVSYCNQALASSNWWVKDWYSQRGARKLVLLLW